MEGSQDGTDARGTQQDDEYPYPTHHMEFIEHLLDAKSYVFHIEYRDIKRLERFVHVDKMFGTTILGDNGEEIDGYAATLSHKTRFAVRNKLPQYDWNLSPSKHLVAQSSANADNTELTTQSGFPFFIKKSVFMMCLLTSPQYLIRREFCPSAWTRSLLVLLLVTTQILLPLLYRATIQRT